MKKYYLDSKEILLGEVIGEGEEGKIHFVNDFLVAKIFKDNRRVDIRKPDLDFYKYLTNFKLDKFYFPTDIIYDEYGTFSGCVMKYFKDGKAFPSCQYLDVSMVIKELRLLEEELKLISDSHIHIFDVKPNDILVNDTGIGVFDTGLYYRSEEKDLLKQNLILINYALRAGLLWLYKDKSAQELKAYDLPEIYDILDDSIAYLSDILESEVEENKVKTITSLKEIYKTKKFC